MNLQDIANKMKREINAKSKETGKLRTIRVATLKEISDELSKSSSEAAKKAARVIDRDINRVYSEGVPPRRGELKKAFDKLQTHLDGSNRTPKKVAAQKAA
jgi:hypothetical protein